VETSPPIFKNPRRRFSKKRKRFFLKKEAKTFLWLSRTSWRQPRKSFLVLFFKKERLRLTE
jgi:hypothetical protein